MAFSKANYLELLKTLPEGVKLLAATKYADVEDMKAAIEAGVHIIGENRVQDAQAKFPHIKNISKHFIGHLQTNKVKEAVKLFDVIQSVDSARLAKKINEEAFKIGKIMPIMIEINVSNDDAKFGLFESEIFKFVELIKKLKNLKLIGLMTIVAFHENPEDARVHFRQMKKLFDETKKIDPDLHFLSMGMSHDYKVAVEEGSNLIRIGSYLFK